MANEDEICFAFNIYDLSSDFVFKSYVIYKPKFQISNPVLERKIWQE